jgi:uncharacterized protein (TIGR00369 family)
MSIPQTPEALNAIHKGSLADYLGVETMAVGEGTIDARLTIQGHHVAPNGFLHGASVVALADTACGNGTAVHLPEGALGFTTIELKINFLGTATEGTLHCEAKLVHRGRTTQVWDARVRSLSSQRTIALFRCTQMILWPATAGSSGD